MTIYYKLPLMVISATLMTGLLLGFLTVRATTELLDGNAEDALTALRAVRHDRVVDYLETLERTVTVLAASGSVGQTLLDFESAFDLGGAGAGDRMARFRQGRKASREAGVLSATAAADASGLAAYDEVRRHNDPWFRKICEDFGYADLYLVSRAGDVVYSTGEGADFAVDLNRKAWRDSALAQSFRGAMTADAGAEARWSDFAPYAPGGGAPAAFISAPVYHLGGIVGALVVRISTGGVDRLMRSGSGMGATGATYVVGRDRRLRSAAQFGTSLTPIPPGDAAGAKGVLSTIQPIAFPPLHWFIVAERKLSEIRAPVEDLQQRLILLGLLVTLSVASLGVLASIRITRPLAALSRAIAGFAATREPVRLAQSRRSDEIGEIAGAFEGLSEEVGQYIRELAESRDELERQRAAVDQASSQLRIALDNMPGGIGLYDADLRIVVANDKVRRFFELPTDLMRPGRSIVDTFRVLAERGDYGPGDPATLVQRRIDAYASRRPHLGEARTPSGRIVEMRLSPVPDGGTVVTFEDVTERRHAENALKESEARLQALLDNSPASITLKDPQGRYLFVNRVMEERWRKPNAEFVGKTNFDLLPIATARLVEAQEREVMATKRAVTVENRPTFPDGRTMHFMMTKFPILDEDGEVSALGLVSMDVTALKEAERALQASEARLRTVLANMEQGVILFDAQFRVVLCNEQAGGHWDLPADTLRVGASFFDLARLLAERGDLERAEVERMDGEAARQAILATPHATEYRRHDGRVLDIRRSPVPGGGFLVTQSDVTERKRIEQDALEKSRLLELTLQNMGQGLTMYDSDWRLVVHNDRYREHFDLPADVFDGEVDFDAVVGATMRRDYGEEWRERLQVVRDPGRMTSIWRREFTRPGGRCLDLLSVPVPTGGFVVTSTDVTERQRAADALGASERRLQTVLQNMDQGVVLYDSDFNVELVNERARELWGVSGSVLREGARFADFARHLGERGDLTAEQVARVSDPAVLEVMSRTVHSTEQPLLDGRVLELRRSPVPSGGFVATQTDVTRRRAMEDALRENQRGLTAILDASPFAVSIIDADGRRLYANPRMADILGMTPKQMVGGASIDVLSPEDLAEMERIYQTEGMVRDFDSEVRIGSGEPFWVTQTMAPIEFGTTPGRIIWVYDITARKHAEAALRRSEAELAKKSDMLQTVFSSMNEGIVAFDHELKLLAWNELYFSIRDFPPAFGNEGRPFEDFVRYDVARFEFGAGDPEQVISRVVARAQDSELHDFERQRPDGTWIHVRGAPLPGGGFVSTFSDITERKLADERIRRAFAIINESVNYASQIQRSLLPTQRQLDARLSRHFVLWEPRDVVGGDFYWLRPCRDGTLLIVCDCTGHGVPGAFMTIIGTAVLDEALARQPDGDPGRLLAEMNRGVKHWLLQDGHDGYSDDGMELGICRIDAARREVVFAGARLSLLVAEDGEVSRIAADRIGIGYRRVDPDYAFTNHRLEVGSEAVLYLHTDGITDQIGGARRRAFGRRRLMQLLAGLGPDPSSDSRRRIKSALSEHQGVEPRRDDVTVIGFKP